MREILFRGKRTRDGEWVEGSLLIDTYDRAGKTEKYYRIIGCTYGDADDNGLLKYQLGFDEEVDRDTVGQFTGRVDKNGKKVFEGDVLKISRKMDGMGTYYAPPLEYPVKVAVKWDMCAWMWETIEQDRYYISFPDAWCHFDCEVVGNIWDNPELIQRDGEVKR